MKWLFAILVALNIIVFGSMIAGKLVHSNSGAPAAASAASPETEAVAPASPDISVRQATETETVAGSNTTAAKAASKTETIAAPKTTTEIGRASCRERGEISVVAETIKKKKTKQ